MVLCATLTIYRMKMLPDEARWLVYYLKKYLDGGYFNRRGLSGFTLQVIITKVREHLAELQEGQAFDINFNQSEAEEIRRILENPPGHEDSESEMDYKMRAQFWGALENSDK
jgi:hypothetical protein